MQAPSVSAERQQHCAIALTSSSAVRLTTPAPREFEKFCISTSKDVFRSEHYDQQQEHGRRSIESTSTENQDKMWAMTVSPERSSSDPNEVQRRGRPKLGLKARCAKLYRSKSWSYWILLLLSCLAMLTAFPASSLLTRLYFTDGGTSKWIISWLAPAGWPISALFLITYCVIEREFPSPLTWELTFAYTVIGFLSAADNLMYAYAYSYLPASTAALLASSSLAFTAILAFFMVGLKYNSAIINSVGIMTTAAVLLGLDSSSDRPFGVSSSQYTLGFFLDIAASAVHGLIFTLSELLFIKLLGRKSFRVVLEAQTATSVLATIFTTIGVLAAGDFQKIHTEAQNFKNGPGEYYHVFAWSAVSFQLGILGSVGCLYLANSLLAGVLNAARVPATAVGAVIIFSDPMGGIKILAVVLTVWSLASYMWGTRSLRGKEEDDFTAASGATTSSLAGERRVHSASNAA
ncbi:hypothetical protein R1sor_006361 [Riccia sorocarpa]|uniref:Probable purine permease n=1 Tax=Riccia sorocarpa TaxID=122646 RepID=A0ABD3HR19_9MARC